MNSKCQVFGSWDMKVSSEDGARAQHKEALAAHRVMLEAR